MLKFLTYAEAQNMIGGLNADAYNAGKAILDGDGLTGRLTWERPLIL